MGLPSFSLLEMATYAFSIAFPLWPIVLISPLGRRGRVLENMLIVWVPIAMMRVFLFFESIPTLFTTIPEPFSTILFFITNQTGMGVF